MESPTAYDRVQNRQYTGHIEVAADASEAFTIIVVSRAHQEIELCQDIDEPDPQPASRGLHARNPDPKMDDL